MLSRFEFLFSILGGWILSIVIYIIFNLRRGETLPNGSEIIELEESDEAIVVPGYTPLLLIGMGTISFLLIFSLILAIFDLWDIILPFIAFDLPLWLNWIGIIGIWFQDGWGISVFLYNVNYTPAYKGMKKGYILATGGPYKYVRHPMYMVKAIQVIFFFLATGIFFSLIGILTWFALPSQANKEEEALKLKFGKKYSEYSEKTGKFFPKLLNI